MAVAQGVAATTGGAEPPGPMQLEQLQLSGAAQAPVPLSPGELAALSTSGQETGGGGAPPPMPIEQLQVAGVGGAPAPEPLGALTLDVGAPPEPMSLEELAALGASSGDGGGDEPDGPKSSRRGSPG